jgi:hypothetical protein
LRDWDEAVRAAWERGGSGGSGCRGAGGGVDGDEVGDGVCGEEDAFNGGRDGSRGRDANAVKFQYS